MIFFGRFFVSFMVVFIFFLLLKILILLLFFIFFFFVLVGFMQRLGLIILWVLWYWFVIVMWQVGVRSFSGYLFFCFLYLGNGERLCLMVCWEQNFIFLFGVFYLCGFLGILMKFFFFSFFQFRLFSLRIFFIIFLLFLCRWGFWMLRVFVRSFVILLLDFLQSFVIGLFRVMQWWQQLLVMLSCLKNVLVGKIILEYRVVFVRKMLWVIIKMLFFLRVFLSFFWFGRFVRGFELQMQRNFILFFLIYLVSFIWVIFLVGLVFRKVFLVQDLFIVFMLQMKLKGWLMSVGRMVIVFIVLLFERECWKLQFMWIIFFFLEKLKVKFLIFLCESFVFLII